MLPIERVYKNSRAGGSGADYVPRHAVLHINLQECPLVGTKTQRNTTYLVGVPVVRSCIDPFSLVACQQFFLELETHGINNAVMVCVTPLIAQALQRLQ